MMEQYIHKSDETTYGSQYMKKKQPDHLGDQIIVTELNRKKMLAHFKIRLSKSPMNIVFKQNRMIVKLKKRE